MKSSRVIKFELKNVPLYICVLMFMHDLKMSLSKYKAAFDSTCPDYYKLIVIVLKTKWKHTPFSKWHCSLHLFFLHGYTPPLPLIFEVHNSFFFHCSCIGDQSFSSVFAVLRRRNRGSSDYSLRSLPHRPSCQGTLLCESPLLTAVSVWNQKRSCKQSFSCFAHLTK